MRALLMVFCSVSFLLLSSSASAQLRLVAPNGGERFLVGSTTTIQWAGIPASDVVTLEYSTDNGGSWNLITNQGTGLQHTWANIPNTPSDFCLMRASTGATVGDTVLYLKSERPGFILPDAIHYAEFSPDGTKVIGGGAQGDVFIWDSFTGVLLNRFPVEPGPFPSQPGIAYITSVRYSPDGNFFATTSPIDAQAGSTVRIYNATTGGLVRQWQRIDAAPVSVSSPCAYSPDGTKLLVTGLEGGIVYNVSDGSVVTQLTGYVVTVGSTTYSFSMGDGEWRRDGSEIIGSTVADPAVGRDIILSDPVTGAVINTYAMPSPGMMEMARYSPDGSRFLSISLDGFARVYDIASGTEVFSANDYERYPNWGEFSDDGLFLATAGQDNQLPNWKLKLYDATTGAFIRDVGAIINGMRNLDFSPDGSRILVSCIDGVRIFHAPESAAGQTDVSDALWAIYVNPAAITVSAPTVTARQGEFVDVPIMIDDAAAALGGGATRVDISLRYNVSLLDPVGTTPRGVVGATERTIDVSLPIPAAGETVLGTLRFKAALGNDSTTALDLSGAATDAPTVTVTEQDGVFRLSDLCYEGGARLLNPDGVVSLKVVNAGVISRGVDVLGTTFETGRTTLTLVDVNGRTVRQCMDGEAPPGEWHMRVSLDDVAPGRYFLVLATPTVMKTLPFEVVE